MSKSETPSASGTENKKQAVKKTARILLLCDETVPAFYQNWHPGVFDGIDLIISCGDLPSKYLTFIADMFHGEVLYVPGNHDEGYLSRPPLGCISIDGRIHVWKGIRFLGLGGSMRYKDGPYQYTDSEMKARVRRMWFSLLRRQGFDVLVTHAPAAGIHDGKDRCHQGFTIFRELIQRYHPRYFFHGHVHLTYGNFPRMCHYESTLVVNGYERFVVEVDLPEAYWS